MSKILTTSLALLVHLPALACTAEGSAMADKLREKGLAGKHKVVGVFKIVKEESWVSAEKFPMTVKGTIVTPKGRIYRTTHDENGEIVSCAVYFTPKDSGEGVFYLKRRKKGEYQLIHWEGDYLMADKSVEKKD